MSIVCHNVGDYDSMMQLEMYCDLLETWIQQMPVPPSRQLIGHSEFVVEHGGNRFDIGGADDAMAQAEYQRDEMVVVPDYGSRSVIAYFMRLSGVHAGP